MYLRIKVWVAVCFAFYLFSFAGTGENIPHLRNFHQVSEELYRSGQPDHKDMLELEKSGFKSVINLRNGQNDRWEARGTKLQTYQFSMKAGKVDYEDVLNVMTAIRDAPKPTLIHCRRGSDRTGCMVAVYHIVFMGWSKEKAIEEFRNPDLGYLESLFPNLISLVENLDVEKLKEDLQKRSSGNSLPE